MAGRTARRCRDVASLIGITGRTVENASSVLIDDLAEGCHRGKLTFVTSPAPRAQIEFDRLRRVLEPVSRSKSGIQAKVADVATGRSRHAESQNELRAFRVLLATAHPDAWQEQPLLLEYQHQGTTHRYTPDILVVWGTHQEIVEVKEDSEADKPENQVRFALMRELLGQHGYLFRLWRRSEICAEPRLSNANLILRYRCVSVSAAEKERIRRAFSSERELSLGRFYEPRGITVPSVLRLVLEGTLNVNWWEPLSLNSRVSITPIGRQVWPSPPPILSGKGSLEGSCR